jgi:hypothetical protein
MSQKIKKKNILVVCSQYISKSQYFFPLLDFPNTIMEKDRTEFKSNFIYKFNKNENKSYLFIFYFVNNTNINSKIEYDGIVEIFDSYDSLDFLRQFDEKFFTIFGNKYYPKVYVNLNEQNFNLQENFPILSKSILLQNDWDEILKSLLVEFKKNKNDEFPYNQMVKSDIKLIDDKKKNKEENFCFPIILYLLIMGISLFDLIIFFLQNDFLNCDIKINELFLYFRLIRVIGNFLIPLIIINNCKRKKKFIKSINIFHRICILINLISFLFEELSIIFFSYKKNSNKNFYSFQITHLISIILIFIVYFIKKSPKYKINKNGYQNINEYKYD